MECSLINSHKSEAFDALKKYSQYLRQFSVFVYQDFFNRMFSVNIFERKRNMNGSRCVRYCNWKLASFSLIVFKTRGRDVKDACCRCGCSLHISIALAVVISCYPVVIILEVVDFLLLVVGVPVVVWGKSLLNVIVVLLCFCNCYCFDVQYFFSKMLWWSFIFLILFFLFLFLFRLNEVFLLERPNIVEAFQKVISGSPTWW